MTGSLGLAKICPWFCARISELPILFAFSPLLPKSFLVPNLIVSYISNLVLTPGLSRGNIGIFPSFPCSPRGGQVHFPFHTCPCSKKFWSPEWTLPILSIRRSAHLAGDTAFMTLLRSFYVHRKNKKGSDNKGIPLWLGAFMIPHGYGAGISCGNCGICVLNVGGRGLMVTYISHVYLSESVK